ncbi:MAG: hypothetical protein E7505_09910 [Ruminococcus sp.]|nr:hypothetical protein [Ruminococcus sp.]
MNAVFKAVKKFHIEAVCAAPVHTGCAEGEKGDILIHPETARPFIQGTSIAGVFRSFTKENHGAQTADKWFGVSSDSNSGNTSRITFTDALFSDSAMLETRPHVRINPASSSVSSGDTIGTSGASGQLLDMTYISEGSALSFDIYVFMDNADDNDNVIEKCLYAVDNGDIRFGGRTTTGCGILKLTGVELTRYDMSDAEDRKAWAYESKKPTDADFADKLKDFSEKSCFTRITASVAARRLAVKGSFVDDMLLRENDYTDKRIPDSMPAVNGAGSFVVPGSSLKGLFRSHISAITSYMGMTELFMEKTFSDKSKSRLFFRDSVVDGCSVKLNTTTRNKIDKLTGGTMDKALFKEADISGSFDIAIDIDSRISDVWSEEDIKRAAALVVMCIRDLDAGRFSIGSGEAIGRGYTDVSSVTINTPDGEEYSIDFEKSSMDEKTQDYINSCLEALKEEDEI